jgi:hypothetical protein
MRFCEISKEMSSLYLELAVFCLSEAKVPEFDTQPMPPNSCSLYSVHCTLNTTSNSRAQASNWLNTSSAKYNGDISLPIKQYLISGAELTFAQVSWH